MRNALLLVLLLSPALAQAQAPAPLAPGVALASFDTAWASMSRTYWDTTFLQTRWRAVRDSLRPLVQDTRDVAVLRTALGVLVATPGQSHFGVIPQELSPTAAGGADPDAPRGSAGVELRLADGALVAWQVAASGAAAAAGIRPGDAISGLGKLTVDSIRRVIRAARPDPAHADRTLLQVAVALTSGAVGDSVRVEVEGRGVRWLRFAPPLGTVTQVGNLPPLTVSVTTARRAVGARSVAVIGLSAWFPAVSRDIDRAVDAARDADGIVLDLRGNPGGIVGMLAGVAGHFLDSAATLGRVTGRQMDLKLIANPRRVNPAGQPVTPYAGPVAVLVDAMTASTSEFFAAGLQAVGRARVFGQPSSGQALPSVMRRLPSGDVLMHPIADHVDAQGRRVEGAGVIPDETIPLTRRDLSAGRDAVLDAALRWIADAAPRR
jgi:carboxyl-terminal processing protease